MKSLTVPLFRWNLRTILSLVLPVILLSGCATAPKDEGSEEWDSSMDEHYLRGYDPEGEAKKEAALREMYPAAGDEQLEGLPEPAPGHEPAPAPKPTPAPETAPVVKKTTAAPKPKASTAKKTTVRESSTSSSKAKAKPPARSTSSKAKPAPSKAKSTSSKAKSTSSKTKPKTSSSKSSNAKSSSSKAKPKSASSKSKSTSKSKPSSSKSRGTYQVKSGDTLWKIAKAKGVSVSRLKAANGLKKDSIRPGERLKIP